MRIISLILQAALFFSGAVFCPQTESEEDQSSPIPSALPFEWRQEDLLLRDEAGNPTALMTPIFHYGLQETQNFSDNSAKNSFRKEFSVDLIGTVHFADREYYEELNRRFRDYDAVLVEMILPRGVPLSALCRKSSPYRLPRNLLELFADIQQGAGRSLGLTNQLDVIDYSAPNLLRADMDSEDFFARFQGDDTGGDSGFFKEFYKFLDNPEESAKSKEKEVPSDQFYDHLTYSRFFVILSSRDFRLHLRRFFAAALSRQLCELDEEENETREEINGETSSQHRFQRRLIMERNALVLTAIRHQQAEGKRHIAVFYGIAHLPDLAAHLESDFSLTLIQIELLKAWNLLGSQAPAPNQFDKTN